MSSFLHRPAPQTLSTFTMSTRSVYLAKSLPSNRVRAHFGLFVPYAGEDRADLGQNFKTKSCKGSIIHVVGEPLMNGYQLEFKRNYDCIDEQDLRELIPLGQVNSDYIFNPTSSQFVRETIPRGRLEQEATRIPPPPGGQDLRAPIDGVW